MADQGFEPRSLESQSLIYPLPHTGYHIYVPIHHPQIREPQYDKQQRQTKYLIHIKNPLKVFLKIEKSVEMKYN